MKKLTILYLLAASLSLSANAQRNFAPLGAEWRFVAGVYEDMPCEDHVLLTVESEIEIDGKLCGVIRKYSKHQSEPDFLPTPDSLVVWEENGRVYFYATDFFSPEGFYLLYDFNLAAGDTLKSYLPYNAAAFGLLNYSDNCCDQVRGPILNLVTSSTLVEVDGQFLRQMETEPLFPDSEEECRRFETILEKVGCTTGGLAGSLCDIVLGACQGYFVCYKDEELLLGGNDEMMCDFPTSVSWTEAEKEIIVSPNPATESLTLELPAPPPVAAIWTLHAATGQPVLRAVLAAGQTKLSIPLEGLPPGLYFWKVASQGRSVGEGKVVVLK